MEWGYGGYSQVDLQLVIITSILYQCRESNGPRPRNEANCSVPTWSHYISSTYHMCQCVTGQTDVNDAIVRHFYILSDRDDRGFYHQNDNGKVLSHVFRTIDVESSCEANVWFMKHITAQVKCYPLQILTSFGVTLLDAFHILISNVRKYINSNETYTVVRVRNFLHLHINSRLITEKDIYIYTEYIS